jgi:hypothetical protein
MLICDAQANLVRLDEPDLSRLSASVRLTAFGSRADAVASGRGAWWALRDGDPRGACGGPRRSSGWASAPRPLVRTAEVEQEATKEAG